MQLQSANATLKLCINRIYSVVIYYHSFQVFILSHIIFHQSLYSNADSNIRYTRHETSQQAQ